MILPITMKDKNYDVVVKKHALDEIENFVETNCEKLRDFVNENIEKICAGKKLNIVVFQKFMSSEDGEGSSSDPVFHEDLRCIRSLVSPLCSYIISLHFSFFKTQYCIK